MELAKPNLRPTLEGKLIRLRPLEAGDFCGLYLVASDPLIWEQHPQPNRYQQDVFQKFFNEALESKGALIIEDSASGKPIGSSRYYDFDPVRKIMVVGYTFLGRAYWGGAHNRELKELMLRYAFRFVENIHFHIGDTNLRSRKAIEKIGARIVEQIPIQGKIRVVYEIDKATFVRLFI